MAQSSRPCKGCGATIPRTKPTAPIQHYCGAQCRPRCSAQGCDKPRHGSTYCSAHHTRWKRTGDPLTPLERTPNVGACSVDGCDEPMRKREWCAKHYSMWAAFGEIREWHHTHGSGGYVPTHKWVAKHRGKAAQHSCVDCGEPAAEWSYATGHPLEQIDSQGRRFARALDAYQPRCVSCHRIYDENPIAIR